MNKLDNNISIEPTEFVPSDSAQSRWRPNTWQIALGAFVLVVLFVFWFLFTSKSVQLKFTPAAEQVTVEGGFSFELGGVYLLREGSYTIAATTALHEPLSQDIVVTDQRNQIANLTFTPLPGFLNLDLTPQDATVAIDGKAVIGSEVVELPAGEHEVSVSHPRYIPQAQVVEIEGKQTTQNLAVQLEPNWAEVEVVSTPPGAEIWIDDNFTELLTPATIEALAGEREIRVQLEGFKTHRERIFAQAGVPLELTPVKLQQADAKLQVTSAPSGAGVTVNGQFVGQTPLQLDLKSGVTHTITLIRSGYSSETRQQTLQRGESDRLFVQLTQQTGKVVVKAIPADAQLSVDGRILGGANQVLTLPIRPHQLAISLDGYAGFSQTITPKVGLTQEVKVKLLTLAEARLQALQPTVATNAGQTLKLFQPFDFTMGASRREPGRRANETLRDVGMSRLFYLGLHEVTNAQFRQFASGHDSGSFEEVSLNEDDMPVSSVGWHEAAAYCNWLSDAEGLPRFYTMEFGKVIGTNPTATGYRLPTEAEWAWAARTWPQPNTDETPLLRFPWGANLPPPDRHGNYADRAASSLVGRVIFGYNDNHTAAAPIGTFKANQHGLYDIGGNVAEWVHDFYEIPNKETVTDPLGPDSGDYHVMRGSSWMHGTITELRFSFRDYGIDGRQDVGFRIARYAE